jgi:hypothetical protein
MFGPVDNTCRLVINIVIFFEYYEYLRHGQPSAAVKKKKNQNSACTVELLFLGTINAKGVSGNRNV